MGKGIVLRRFTCICLNNRLIDCNCISRRTDYIDLATTADRSLCQADIDLAAARYTCSGCFRFVSQSDVIADQVDLTANAACTVGLNRASLGYRTTNKFNFTAIIDH